MLKPHSFAFLSDTLAALTSQTLLEYIDKLQRGEPIMLPLPAPAARPGQPFGSGGGFGAGNAGGGLDGGANAGGAGGLLSQGTVVFDS